MKVTVIEEVLLSLVNYIPYALFIVYAFRSDLKISKVWTNFIIAVSAMLEIAFWVLFPTPDTQTTQMFSLLLTIASFAFYVAVVNINFYHATFRVLVVNNIANYIVVAAKFIEGKVFPQLASGLSHLSYSLCMVGLQVVILGVLAYELKAYDYGKLSNNIDPTIWRYLCFIPVTFYVIWHYVLYHTTNMSSLQMALDPVHAFFQTVIFGGQMLIYLCVYKLVAAYNKLMELEEENSKLNLQTMQYQSMQKHINEVRVMRHDIRHHLQLISGYVKNKKIEQLENYLNEYTQILDDEITVSYCQNVTLNMLLVYYSRICKEKNIEFDVEVDVPVHCILSDSEIAVLFGNLLENVCDACQQQKSGNRKISFHGMCKNQFVFTIDNTFKNQILKDAQNRFLSTKHSGYGVGTISAQNIVEKHQGVIRFEMQKELFCVSIILPK